MIIQLPPTARSDQAAGFLRRAGALRFAWEKDAL